MSILAYLDDIPLFYSILGILNILGANLSDAELRDADLRYANLKGEDSCDAIPDLGKNNFRKSLIRFVLQLML